jgi:glycosyltransferase involved in cell wall biosynthesis
VYQPNEKMSVLHIILAVRETSAAYNEHCLPWADKRDISICTYWESDIAPPSSITLFEGDGSLMGFFRTLKTALRAKEYDVIHAHSPHVGFLFLFVTLFSYLKYASSTVVTVHDSFQNYKLRNQLMYLPIFAAFRKVICCSRSSYESFPERYKWLAGGRLSYVQNGVDIDRIDRLAAQVHRAPRRTDDFKLVAISRLVEIKNPYLVLSAFQSGIDPASRLVYIGDGHLRRSLIAASEESGVESQVTFTGLIPRTKVFEHLLNADLFISPSLGEGLPVAVMEAMACGCPVLLSDIPPHRELADEVDFIPLIPPHDVEGFAREIKKYREMPAAERQAIGQKCRKLVEERFSLSAMHAGYSEVYSQLVRPQIPGLVEEAG